MYVLDNCNLRVLIVLKNVYEKEGETFLVTWIKRYSRVYNKIGSLNNCSSRFLNLILQELLDEKAFKSNGLQNKCSLINSPIHP